MRHIATLDDTPASPQVKSLLARATGRFYTPEFIVTNLIDSALGSVHFLPLRCFRIVDPFCGDGRLLVALIRRAHELGLGQSIPWHVALWDLDAQAVSAAREAVLDAAIQAGITVELETRCQDTLLCAHTFYSTFHCVVTNPPWEAIKPDRRELAEMSAEQAGEYKRMLSEYDARLAAVLPLAQPRKKFSGWGTNLSRCGTEVALRLTAAGGVCGIVVPASLLTDQMTTELRRWMLESATWLSIEHYPAEARLFEAVDQACLAIVVRNSPSAMICPVVTRFDRRCRLISRSELTLSQEDLRRCDYTVSIDTDPEVLKLLERWQLLPTIGDLEDESCTGLWMGRELDETNRASFLSETGEHPFFKGRMITRYAISEQPTHFVREDVRRIPPSALHDRIAWRDVSRRSQSRRMHAARIPAGAVTGNSLHVAYFRDDDSRRLRALLAIMNSIPCESQIRARLGTGHVSLGAVRQAHIPSLSDDDLLDQLNAVLTELEKGSKEAEAQLEVIVARAYQLNRSEYEVLLSSFGGIPTGYVASLLTNKAWEAVMPSLDEPSAAAAEEVTGVDSNVLGKPLIPNHYSAGLSPLDLQIARAVPPGGNWKNIPESVPSARLVGIRKSFAAGEGSRSTYYGRLRPDAPSYTINTYFSRPGNGCHLHYDYDGGQHRVISQREAARLQSFPDSFTFVGTRSSINKQIGNAVPPLLAYQVARAFPFRGQFVDLFCGAGGLSLGFLWAGWQPLVANDVEASFLDTYHANIHSDTICGDIRDRAIFEAIVDRVLTARVGHEHVPLIVIGGPPCQGFSTAGNRRSMDDARNHLFDQYKAMLEILKPTGFVFENVTGILNMEGGRVFEAIKRELQIEAKAIAEWHLRAEQYAVPQRRTRVVLVGHPSDGPCMSKPEPITDLKRLGTLFEPLPAAITVGEALADLPPLQPGEDGSHKGYVCAPSNPYQLLMRGAAGPDEYLRLIRSHT